MTVETSNGYAIGSFWDPGSWTPGVVPQSGDVENITAGELYAVGQNLHGLTINLGSPYDYAGPVSAFYEPSPNPTLDLSDAVIAYNTVIETPQSPSPSGAYYATILVEGSFENDGTIGLPVNTGAPSILNIVMEGEDTAYDTGYSYNYGTINISPQQSTVLSGFTVMPDSQSSSGYDNHQGSVLYNYGNINVYGTLSNESVTIQGSGTVTLNAVANGLGLPPTPSFLELDNNYIAGGGEIFQSIVFNGGHLAFGASNGVGGHIDGGTFLNFASSPNNMIQIKDFSIGSVNQTGSSVQVMSTTGGEFSANFVNLPQNGELNYYQDGTTLDITWHVQPTAGGNGPTPVPSPVHNPPPHYPPGYHLS